MKKPVSINGKYFESKREAAQYLCDMVGRPNLGYGFEKQLQQKKEVIEGFKITYHN